MRSYREIGGKGAEKGRKRMNEKAGRKLRFTPEAFLTFLDSSETIRNNQGSNSKTRRVVSWNLGVGKKSISRRRQWFMVQMPPKG